MIAFALQPPSRQALHVLHFGSQQTSSNFSSMQTHYSQPENRQNTITILGTSAMTRELARFGQLCEKVVIDLVKKGANILTCGGTSGLYGIAFRAAKDHSRKDPITGKPIQNLAVLHAPLWGDEDIHNCVPIGIVPSEPERSNKFYESSDTFIIFPGRTTTILEAVVLIQKNEHRKNAPLKKIILVGRDFFQGLHEQYKQLYRSGFLKHLPEQLYRIVDNEQELQSALRK
ncbi:MAG: LOG family protein [Vampirovibrionales bacterium]|nr:LOG family protein [Vampirovibrionales bacterium]